MAKQFENIKPNLQEFIEKQKIFFVATAAQTGRVNLSPKGMDSLRILNPNKVAWLNSTGSGNETAAHILQNPRMTIMFCAFEGPPMILRLYGTAKAHYPGDAGWAELASLFRVRPETRQIFTLEIDLVQTSCGMAVPFFDYATEREELNEFWGSKTEEQIKTYHQEKNVHSIDGFETGLPTK